MMSIREDPTVADKVMVWRRDEGDEFREELLWGHVDGAGFARKVQSNAATGQPLDGLGGEGGSQEMAAESLEALAIASVHGRGSMQVHAEGRDIEGGAWW